MATPEPLRRAVAQNRNDIGALYELLETVDGRLATLERGQDSLATGQTQISAKLDQLLVAMGIDPGTAPTA